MNPPQIEEPLLPQNIQEKIDQERTRLLYSNGYGANSIVIILALILTVLIRSESSLPLINLWLTFTIVLAVGRIFLVWQRQRSPLNHSDREWVIAYGATTTLLGLSWALLAGISFGQTIFLDMVTILFVVGITSLAIPILISFPPIMKLYFFPATFMLIGLLIGRGEQSDWLLALALTLYSIVILRSASRFYQVFTNALRLGFENESLAAGLEERHQISATLNQQLQQEIAERRSVEEQLKMESASKAQFLANMSHEIRTPMNAIIGMTDLALNGTLDPQQRNYLSKIRIASESLLHIINDILDFSKIESGRLTLEHIDFNLEEVLEQVAIITGQQGRSSGLELVFQVPTCVPRQLRGDPLRLGQILINLVNNAIKFTERGGEMILAVTLERELMEQVTLQFTVQDNGIGMTAEQLQRLFQSFSQADSSITRRYGGSGLGLLISKRLSELMGGQLTVESQIGIGTTFSLTLPLTRQPIQHLPPIAHPAPTPLRVLVVEDHPISRMVYQEQFESLGIRPILATSAEEALTLIHAPQNDYDLLLLDHQLPGLTGHELIEQIEASQLSYRPKIILVSGAAPQQLELYQRFDSVARIFAKPLLLTDLQAVLADLFTTSPSPILLATNRTDQPHTDSSRLHGARLLLVEDNEFNQEVAIDLLKQYGAVVDLATNGQEALNRLKERSYELVLMDCIMPIMDGYTATQLIRQQEEWRDLPILAMTANALAEERQKVQAVGMNEQITKPFREADLIATLLKWLPKRAAVPSSKPTATLQPAPPDSHQPLSERLLHRRIEAQSSSLSRFSLPATAPLEPTTVTLTAFTRSHPEHFQQQLHHFCRRYCDFDRYLQNQMALGYGLAAQRRVENLKNIASMMGMVELYRALNAFEEGVLTTNGLPFIPLIQQQIDPICQQLSPSLTDRASK